MCPQSEGGTGQNAPKTSPNGPKMRFGAILDHLKAILIHFGPFEKVEKFSILTSFGRFLDIFGHFWPILGPFLLSLLGGFPLWPLWETQNFNIGAKKNNSRTIFLHFTPLFIF